MKYIILLTAVALSIFTAAKLHLISKDNVVVKAETVIVEEPKRYVPTHAQTVWLHALEWCESRGKESSINPEDRDGTPSYYSFQFKPSTFKSYALKYGLLESSDLNTDAKVMKEMSNYNTQKAIVTEMLNDPKVKWNNEFPDCTKRKIGLPPRY